MKKKLINAVIVLFPLLLLIIASITLATSANHRISQNVEIIVAEYEKGITP